MAELVLLVGSVTEIRVILRTDDGLPIDLSAITEATFSFRKDASDPASDPVSLATTAANLEVDVAEGSLVGALAQVDADQLVPGVYIGQAAVYDPNIGWMHSMPFTVRVLPQIAPHVAVGP